MAQLSIAIALISGLSIAGLGAGLSLLQSDKYPFIGCWKCAFLLSQLFLVISSFLSCGAAITRTLDFRLTARKARSRKKKQPAYNRPLSIFCCDANGLGRWTWRLFWPSCVCLALGAALLIISIGVAYADRLH